jgi:hypothetical protein
MLSGNSTSAVRHYAARNFQVGMPCPGGFD